MTFKHHSLTCPHHQQFSRNFLYLLLHHNFPITIQDNHLSWLSLCHPDESDLCPDSGNLNTLGNPFSLALKLESDLLCFLSKWLILIRHSYKWNWELYYISQNIKGVLYALIRLLKLFAYKGGLSRYSETTRRAAYLDRTKDLSSRFFSDLAGVRESGNRYCINGSRLKLPLLILSLLITLMFLLLPNFSFGCISKRWGSEGRVRRVRLLPISFYFLR